MKKFIPTQFYDVSDDFDIEDYPSVTLTPEGIKLVTKYYSNKYGIDIFMLSIDELKNENDKLPDFNSFVTAILKEMNKRSDQELQTVCILNECFHSSVFVYFRQNNNEAILIADSLGNYRHLKDINLISQRIKTFIIEETRQSDSSSCHTDALVWAREITRKNTTGQYQIGNLLSYLEMNSRQTGNIFIVKKLPDQLLITAQISDFMIQYKNDYEVSHKIHKQETLTEFRTRYTSTVKFFDRDKFTNISSYLNSKGFKFTDIIQIQFYCNQLQDELDTKWSLELQDEFFTLAKKTLANKRTNSALYEVAQNFLKNQSPQSKCKCM